MRKRLWQGTLAGVVVASVLLFTPAFQLLVAPLVLRAPLGPADAIVVLGGGVEDDGQPSESTLERIRYGILLYEGGLAGHLILSTGVVEGFSEARAMAEVARQHGVPEEALVLEEISHNTHENIHAVQEILEARGWHRVLVVSSPYHLRRVSLVYRKCCRGVETVWAPADPAGVYQFRGPRHRLKQARAVLREYAAIGWYRLRGYL